MNRVGGTAHSTQVGPDVVWRSTLFLKEPETTVMDFRYSELREHYWEGRLIPFIGAGISASVTWKQGDIVKRGPSWQEMVDQAARSLGFEDPDLLRVRGEDLQILEYFGLKNNGQFAKLTHWMYAEMQPTDADLRQSKIHERLALMDRCRLI